MSSGTDYPTGDPPQMRWYQEARWLDGRWVVSTSTVAVIVGNWLWSVSFWFFDRQDNAAVSYDGDGWPLGIRARIWGAGARKFNTLANFFLK